MPLPVVRLLLVVLVALTCSKAVCFPAHALGRHVQNSAYECFGCTARHTAEANLQLQQPWQLPAVPRSATQCTIGGTTSRRSTTSGCSTTSRTRTTTSPVVLLVVLVVCSPNTAVESSREIPKSESLHAPEELSRMFCGLMSLCTRLSKNRKPRAAVVGEAQTRIHWPSEVQHIYY